MNGQGSPHTCSRPRYSFTSFSRAPPLPRVGSSARYATCSNSEGKENKRRGQPRVAAAADTREAPSWWAVECRQATQASTHQRATQDKVNHAPNNCGVVQAVTGPVLHIAQLDQAPPPSR